MESEAKAFERLPGEPANWHLRFMRYCRMGQSRALLRVFNDEQEALGKKKRLKPFGNWLLRYEQFRWKERAGAYDQWIDQREQRAWERRRKEFREREVKLADALIEKAEKMLQFPLATSRKETSADGVTVTNIITPARWGMRDAAVILDTADKLMRLALMVETSREVKDVVISEDIEDIRRKRWEQIRGELAAVLDDDLEQDGEGEADADDDPGNNGQ